MRDSPLKSRSFIYFAAGILVAWLLALLTPLSPDEAYYWAWAQNPSLGYLDHAPGIAWWMHISPRFSGAILMPIAWILLAFTARRLKLPNATCLPAILCWTPLGLAASVLATPDQPLVFFVSLALFAWSHGFLWLLGLSLAAALYSKSTALLLIPGFLYVLTHPPENLLPTRFKHAILVFAIILSSYTPHIIWSLTHNGLPWTFQSGRSIQSGHFLEFLLGQALAVSPLLFIHTLRACFRFRHNHSISKAILQLSFLSIASFGVAALFFKVEMNWTAVFWPIASLLWLSVTPQKLTRAVKLSFVISASCAFLILVMSPFLKKLDRDCLAHSTPLPLVATRYQDKAMLDLQGAPVPYQQAQNHRISQYDFWQTPQVPLSHAAIGVPKKGDPKTCKTQATPLYACGRELWICE